MKAVYKQICPPRCEPVLPPVDLTAETMRQHLQKVLTRMETERLDTLLVYGDREHGANFAYLTGFEPRFEEALLILQRNDAERCLVLGNENLKMVQYSFLPARAVHAPHFSLPGQPMTPDKPFAELLHAAGVENRRRIGIAGWKLFTSRVEDNTSLFDVPEWIVQAVRACNPDGETLSMGRVFLDPETGVRNQMNANEIAHYEAGAATAAAAVFGAMEQVAPGRTEMEVAAAFQDWGQPRTVTAICAAGERFTNAVVFPRAKKMQMGDRISVTFGLRGGLTSRAGYIAEGTNDLPEANRDYLDRVALPYYKALACWLEALEIGQTCGAVYDAVEAVLSKETYRWTLNPGHLTGQEEWTVSPFAKDSAITLKSGMLLQADIIPSVPGYAGASAEDGLALADAALRQKLQRDYPALWRRFERRRSYIQEVLGIRLRDEVLPLGDLLGYYRPLFLCKDHACAIEE